MKRVDLARREALDCVGAVTILKAATVEYVVEGRGQESTVFAIAKAGKKILLCLSRFNLLGVLVHSVIPFLKFGICQKL